MKSKFILILAAAIAMTTCGCKSLKSEQETGQTETTTPPMPTPGQTTQVHHLPQAIIYKTSGDYNDNVPITLSADRSTIVSYPAPTDIDPTTSSPVELEDGWLLDRRGITPTSAFTSYTYEQYHSLKNVPSPQELKLKIIPDAKIIAIYRLPITAAEALQKPESCNKFISNGFNDCQSLYSAPPSIAPIERPDK